MITLPQLSPKKKTQPNPNLTRKTRTLPTKIYPHFQRLKPNNSKSYGPDLSNPSLNLSPLISFPLYKTKPSPRISKSIFRVLDSLCSRCHYQKTQRTRYPSKPCERETESLITLDSTSDFLFSLAFAFISCFYY